MIRLFAPGHKSPSVEAFADFVGGQVKFTLLAGRTSVSLQRSEQKRGITMKKLLIIAALALPMAPALADAPKPDALVADGIPPVPDELPAETRPYMEFRTASFTGWHPADKSMLVA
jgi:hypothetical protein